MADDSTRRSYRSHEPIRRSGDPTGHGKPAGGDPLAELARLIGQADPYTDLGQASPRRAESQRAAPHGEPADWRKAVAAMPPFEELQPEQVVPAQPAHAAPRAGFERDDDPYYPSALDGPRAGQPVDNERVHRRYDDVQPQHAGHFQDHHDDGRYDGDQQPRRGGAFYAEGVPVRPPDEAMYDDPPRARGRNGLITAVTLVACAMVGTAGAYGYRTYVGNGPARIPPVITAETTPSKVVASNDSQSTKISQDRVRDQGQNERVISREEQPADFRTSTPRVVLPAPVSPSQSQAFTATTPSNARGTGQPSTGAQGSAVQGSGVVGEPKSIRTIPIRPDRADPSARPVTGMTPSGTTQSGATPAAQAPPRPAIAAKQGPAARGAPLSLEPQTPAQASAPQPVPTQPRLASVAPASAPVSAPANVATGGYMVQLSSQRSEGEAQTSFRSLQAKFPDQLGARSPIVRRADLGDKGTYFRAMVGPFGSSEEAGRFCSGLKAAGGQCIIQRN